MKEKYMETLNVIDSILSHFCHQIDLYGHVKITRNKENNEGIFENTYHDYIYYCFTKSTRSLISSIILARKYLSEDCEIILRTVYENYLNMSHVLNKPEKIQEYAGQTVGLGIGHYSYKKVGYKKDFKRVINNETLKEYEHGTSNMIKTKEGINPIDYKIHKSIYGYLSEHTHPNMLASGNYRLRDSSNYVVNPQTIKLEVVFLISYLTYILLDAMYYFENTCPINRAESITQYKVIDYDVIRSELRSEIIYYLDGLVGDYLKSGFEDLIMERITT